MYDVKNWTSADKMASHHWREVAWSVLGGVPVRFRAYHSSRIIGVSADISESPEAGMVSYGESFVKILGDTLSLRDGAIGFNCGVTGTSGEVITAKTVFAEYTYKTDGKFDAAADRIGAFTGKE